MNYNNYKRSRDLAWQILDDCKINALPVQITAIAKKYNIKIVNDSQGKLLKPNESGAFDYVNGNPYIIIDDTDSKQRKRFTVAHELGHILLKHDINCIASKDTEHEANVFATRLLEPACVLWAINCITAKDIAKLCNVSLSAARIRAERMQILNQRSKYLTSPLERKVFDNFKEFIDDFNQKNNPRQHR